MCKQRASTDPALWGFLVPSCGHTFPGVPVGRGRGDAGPRSSGACGAPGFPPGQVRRERGGSRVLTGQEARAQCPQLPRKGTGSRH